MLIKYNAADHYKSQIGLGQVGNFILFATVRRPCAMQFVMYAASPLRSPSSLLQTRHLNTRVFTVPVLDFHPSLLH